MKGKEEMDYFEEEIDELDEKEIDLQMLREDLVGELQAINQYQDHIDSLADEEAVHILEHIRDDEKEHVAELMKVLQRLDTTQAEKLKKEGL
jgi:hypothetical protein